MSSVFRGHVAVLRPRAKPFRSRSMGLCLEGHHPFRSKCDNCERRGLQGNFT